MFGRLTKHWSILNGWFDSGKGQHRSLPLIVESLIIEYCWSLTYLHKDIFSKKERIQLDLVCHHWLEICTHWFKIVYKPQFYIASDSLEEFYTHSLSPYCLFKQVGFVGIISNRIFDVTHNSAATNLANLFTSSSKVYDKNQAKMLQTLLDTTSNNVKFINQLKNNNNNWAVTYFGLVKEFEMLWKVANDHVNEDQLMILSYITQSIVSYRNNSNNSSNDIPDIYFKVSSYNLVTKTCITPLLPYIKDMQTHVFIEDQEIWDRVTSLHNYRVSYNHNKLPKSLKAIDFFHMSKGESNIINYTKLVQETKLEKICIIFSSRHDGQLQKMLKFIGECPTLKNVGFRIIEVFEKDLPLYHDVFHSNSLIPSWYFMFNNQVTDIMMFPEFRNPKILKRLYFEYGHVHPFNHIAEFIERRIVPLPNLELLWIRFENQDIQEPVQFIDSLVNDRDQNNSMYMKSLRVIRFSVKISNSNTVVDNITWLFKRLVTYKSWLSINFQIGNISTMTYQSIKITLLMMIRGSDFNLESSYQMSSLSEITITRIYK